MGVSKATRLQVVVHILDGVPEHPTGLLLALESSPRTLMQSRKHFPSFGHRHLGGRTGAIAHYLAGLIWPPKRLTALWDLRRRGVLL